MRYLYDLINNKTKETEQRGITSSKAAVIMNVPPAQIQWYANQTRKHDTYSLVPIPMHKEHTEPKDTKWWTDYDTLRWNDVCEPFRKAYANEKKQI